MIEWNGRVQYVLSLYGSDDELVHSQVLDFEFGVHVWEAVYWQRFEAGLIKNDEYPQVIPIDDEETVFIEVESAE